MKRLLVSFLLATMALCVMAAFDATDWEWRAPLVRPQTEASGFAQVDLAPWVFDRSQSSLADLRVVDQNGALIPHIIRWGHATRQVHTEWRAVRLLNRTYEPNEYARVVADFGERFEKDSVRIATPGANFRRRVTIEGGGDGAAWERIADNLYLFDISLPNERFQADTLRFASNDFRFLRLTVFNMPEDPRQIEIASVQAAMSFSEKTELTTQPVANASWRWDEKARETICELDLGFKNLPVAKVALEVSDSHFFRGCVVEGRNAPTERIRRKTETGWDETEREAPWNAVQHGVVYRVRDGDKVSESLTFENLNAPYRFVRIRIFDGDNPPLSLRPEDVIVFRRNVTLVLETKAGAQYFLLGGNPNASAADYDLAKAVADLKKQKYPAISLGQPSSLSHEEKLSPWTERHRILIGLGLVLAVAFVAAILISSLRNVRTPVSRQGPKNHSPG